MSYTLIETDSSDWYIIPEDKKKECWKLLNDGDDLPEYAIYISDPARLVFPDYRIRTLQFD